jgi:hypothetical protein
VKLILKSGADPTALEDHALNLTLKRLRNIHWYLYSPDNAGSPPRSMSTKAGTSVTFEDDVLVRKEEEKDLRERQLTYIEIVRWLVWYGADEKIVEDHMAFMEQAEQAPEATSILQSASMWELRRIFNTMTIRFDEGGAESPAV